MILRAPSIPQLLILALILSMPLLYLKASLSEGLGFSGLGLISMGSFRGDFIQPNLRNISAYMILVRGDKVSFDASVLVTGASYHWFLNLTIVDVINGDRWDYSEVFYYARAPTPEFVAPRSSVYMYTLKVGFEVVKPQEGEVRYNVNIKISGSQGKREDIKFRLLVELVILTVLLIASIAISKSKLGEYLAYRGFTSLVRWELRSLWIYTMFAVVLSTYTLVLVNFNSRIGRFPALLGPVAFSNVIEFTVMYLVIVQIVTVILYAYKWEAGHERTMDLLSNGRIPRFIAKLLAVVFVSLIPVATMTLNVYMLWIPEAIIRKPEVLAKLISAQTLYVSLVTLFAISVALLFSTLIPLTSMATLLSVTTTLVLYIDNPLKTALGFDLKKFLEIGDPVMGGRPVAEILYVNVEVLAKLLLPSLVLLSLSLLLYVRRENP